MTKNKWFRFLILYLSAAALSLSQLKISPIQENMGLSLSSYTWLMSIFMVSALVLALPGGSFISRFGAKKTAVIIMVCLVLGNLLGAFSTNADVVTNYNLLLFSRILEGVSFSMINLIAMVFLGSWFKDGSLGIAIGIFGTFSAFASLLGMNIYLPIFREFGLSSVWYFTAAIACIALLGIVCLLEENQDTLASSHQEGHKKSSYKEVFGDKNTWFLAFSMGTMSFVLFTFLAFYPRIMTETFGISIDAANANSGLFGLLGIPFGFVAGIFVDKFKVPPLILGIVTGVIMGLGCLLIAIVPPSLIFVQILVLSIGTSMFSSAIAIAVPRVIKRPILIGQTFAVIYLFYYIGVFIGSPIIASIVEMTGSWKTGAITMMAILFVGAASLLLLLLFNGKKSATVVADNVTVTD